MISCCSTPDQVAEVLRQRSGQQHDPEHVQPAARAHRGLAGERGARRHGARVARRRRRWRTRSAIPACAGDVFSYLAEQVFQRQTEEVQRFLLRTCCLDARQRRARRAADGSSAAPPATSTSSPGTTCSPSTPAAKARIATTTCCATSSGSGSCRTRESGPSGRCSARRRSALEACGDRPGAVELLLGANELELALGVIARGGEAELERRPSEQLRLWVGQARAGGGGRPDPWALIVAGVLDTRESRFSSCARPICSRAAETLQQRVTATACTRCCRSRSGRSSGPATVLPAWPPATAPSTTPRRTLQRLHTLLSLLSAALDMRRWDAVASASTRADELLPRARPEEAARAQALRAHAAFYQGDMRAARRPHPAAATISKQTAAQRPPRSTRDGMIEMALGDYASAARASARGREPLPKASAMP